MAQVQTYLHKKTAQEIARAIRTARDLRDVVSKLERAHMFDPTYWAASQAAYAIAWAFYTGRLPSDVDGKLMHMSTTELAKLIARYQLMSMAAVRDALVQDLL